MSSFTYHMSPQLVYLSTNFAPLVDQNKYQFGYPEDIEIDFVPAKF